MRITVLGAGSWGTTLASVVAERSETTLLARESAVALAVDQQHENPSYLPGVELSPNLRCTDDPASALDTAELVVVAVPSAHVRSVLEAVGPLVPDTAELLSLTKGIESGSGKRMSEVIESVLDRAPGSVSVLSGPNLAREVAAGQPSATVLACPDPDRGARLQTLLTSPSLRVFTNTDVVGCEIGGAVKNVIAIAAGIGDGLGYGWNTKAAVITRGLAEITRLGVALGASPMTFLGLAGHGDLTATCASDQSRNRHVGEALGSGRSVEQVTGEMKMVAEGVATTPAVIELSRRLEVPMPITHLVGAVLRGECSAQHAVERLMGYSPGDELDGVSAT